MRQNHIAPGEHGRYGLRDWGHKILMGRFYLLTNNDKYDPFGTSGAILATDIAQPYTFTGREFDQETGLYYYRNRYYDLNTGRFVSKDPIGFSAGDVNLYRYVGNNPVNWIDPEGLEVERCCRDIQVNPVANAISNFFGLQHCFIRTATKEAGMGPANGGPLPAYPVGIKTEITDHTAQSEQSTCKKVSEVDEDCVNRELQIGKSTGRWLPGNNCNKFIYDIFFKCKRLNIK